MARRSRFAVLLLTCAVVPAAQACGRFADVLEAAPRDGEFSDVDASVGGAPVIGAGGSPAGVGGAAGAPVDPFATQRTGLAASLCAIPLQYPCLTHSGVEGGDTRSCEGLVQMGQQGRYGSQCFEEWAAHVACALARKDYCPCVDGGACVFEPWTDDFGPGCAVTRDALDRCRWGETFGEVIGPAGSYLWSVTGERCQVLADQHGPYRISASCTGAIDGSQSCRCEVNGLLLESITGGEGSRLRASDCKSVAAELASGFCSRALGCCFDHSAAGYLRCDCVEPDGERFPDCVAQISFYGGQLMDVCPRYRKTP